MSEETKAPSIRLERILFLRGHRVVLDEDLATVFGVATKRLNEKIRRNLERFPEVFLFQLSDQEVSNLRSQIATSKAGRGGRPYKPVRLHGTWYTYGCQRFEQSNRNSNKCRSGSRIHQDA